MWHYWLRECVKWCEIVRIDKYGLTKLEVYTTMSFVRDYYQLLHIFCLRCELINLANSYYKNYKVVRSLWLVKSRKR